MTKPTDDELLAVAKEHGTVPTYWTTRLHLVDMLRRAIDMPTLDDAEQLLIGDSGESMDSGKLARALRYRFPQPITDAVLRAAGFERSGGEGTPYLLQAGRRLVIAQDMRDGVFEVQWSIDNDCEVIRTPDRLHDVRVALETLYGPGEEG